ncbi:uncharacterized protein MAM_00983 [Metarhizium album ARSEF 1941]|uniref:Uncharacterized protein n=1 Tax=Metarhizium album (strain ARSEF 1941) TaxID=1081103 RepID=A0A0B2X0B3_METAS|nr:uncharacterized protein MAM_00983 [Metarhizium album ARSEF 1941]KHO01982.1 hypothetical protein MAM_00983 [Metarhizium album ARSEF 1941]
MSKAEKSVLFSAAVIQWVTSKDNAGTSTASSTSGAVNGRDALGQGSARVLTPCAANSSTASTPVELPLVPTARSSTQMDSRAGEAPSTAGGVVITTTIERESKLGGTTQSQGIPMGIPTGCGYQDCFAAEEGFASLQDDPPEAYTSRVNITAGQLWPISP